MDSPPQETPNAPAAESRVSILARRANWFLIALLPVVAVLLFVGYRPVARSSAAMAYPYQLDPEEGFLLDQAIHIARGETIYPPIDDYPYTVGNYPPVYPALVAGMLAVAPPGLALGRAVVLLSVLVIVAAISNIVIRETGRAIPAVLAATLFLATWELNDWIAYARADLPAIAFGMAGLVAITSPRRRTGMVAGVLLFAFAFFTKQTQVVAPAAVVIGLLWARETNRAGLFCVLLAAGCAVPVAVLNVATNGEFLRHTVAYNANEMHWDQLLVWIRFVWEWSKFALLAIAALCVPFAWARIRGGANRLPGPAPGAGREMLATAVAFTALSGLSLVSTAKAGAAGNYLLEFRAAGALLTGLAVGRLANLAETNALPLRRVVRIALGTAVVLLWIHAGSFFTNHSARAPVPRHTLLSPGPAEREGELFGYLLIAIQDTPGDVLCEWPVFTILAGKEVLYQPFIMAQLAREGVWDQSAFVRDLRRQRFELIVTTQDLSGNGPFAGFTDEMREAILSSYERKEIIGQYYLYRPLGSVRKSFTPMVASSGRAG